MTSLFSSIRSLRPFGIELKLLLSFLARPGNRDETRTAPPVCCNLVRDSSIAESPMSRRFPRRRVQNGIFSDHIPHRLRSSLKFKHCPPKTMTPPQIPHHPLFRATHNSMIPSTLPAGKSEEIYYLRFSIYDWRFTIGHRADLRQRSEK